MKEDKCIYCGKLFIQNKDSHHLHVNIKLTSEIMNKFNLEYVDIVKILDNILLENKKLKRIIPWI